MSRFLKAALAGMMCVGLCVATGNRAEAAWPEKTIRIICPYGAGGGNDISSRIFAKYLEKYLPVSVVVSNITGAAGLVAERETLNAAPDGYTWLWQHHKLHATYLAGVSDYSFREFTPLFTIMNNPFSFVAGKNVPEKSVKEVIDFVKKNPGVRSWAFQPRSNTNFYFLDFVLNAGLDPKTSFRPVNNISNDDARLLAMMQGNLSYTLNTTATVIPYAQSGDLRILAIGGTKRMATLPDIPTFSELGINATLAAPYYWALAPRGVPADIQKIIVEAAQKVAENKEFQKESEALGINVEYIAGGAFTQFLQKEEDAMRKLAQEAGILKR